MDLPKSPVALFNKVLLDGSKSLQATEKRDYNDEDEIVYVSTRIAIT